MIEYVYVCAVHIPQSSGAQSMTRSVRLYGFETSVKLTLCVRGERLRSILRRVSRFNVADGAVLNCMDETEERQNGAVKIISGHRLYAI